MHEGKSSLSALTVEALKTGLGSEKPVALKKVGRAAGLIPGGPDSAAKKEARAQCTDARLGLFQKVGGADDNPLLQLTPAGVEALLASGLPTERTKLQAAAAEPFKPTVGAVLARLADQELKNIEGEIADKIRQAGELSAQLMRATEERLKTVERAIEELTKQAGYLRQQQAALENKPTPSGPPATEYKPNPRSERPRPETEEDINFQRDLCRELALVWEDTPEARETLERVMFNSGLEQVGEVGEVLRFDAGQQKLVSGSGILPNHPVKVVEPGWKFESPRGVLLIVKPKVAAEPS